MLSLDGSPLELQTDPAVHKHRHNSRRMPIITKSQTGARFDAFSDRHLPPDKSFAGKFVSQANTSRWKSDEQNDNDEAHRRVGNVEDERLASHLGQKPAPSVSTAARRRGVVSVRKKAGKIHDSGTAIKTFPPPFRKRKHPKASAARTC